MLKPTISGKVKIKLEPGIQSGKVLRLKGKGLPSVNSYGNGDLLIHINVWTPQTLNKEEKDSLKKAKHQTLLLQIQEKKTSLSLIKLKKCLASLK